MPLPVLQLLFPRVCSCCPAQRQAIPSIIDLALYMPMQGDLKRAIECFHEAIMFVDVSTPKWKVAHMNRPAAAKLGLPEGRMAAEFWDLFRTPTSRNSTSRSKSSKTPGEAYASQVGPCGCIVLVQKGNACQQSNGR